MGTPDRWRSVQRIIRVIALLTVVFNSDRVLAHDPIFGLGPHVLYKGGVEIAPHYEQSEAGKGLNREAGLELTYGLTGDWAAGVEVPYVRVDSKSKDDSGIADINLFTKYRFWRHDTLGAQESAAVFFKLKPDTGAKAGTDSTDAILGLAYGYESRKWNRWASVRYRRNGEGDAGLQRGDLWLIDFVGGVRLKPTGYLEPDTVWLLELNGEYSQHTELNGMKLSASGGTEWFISPGIFWTYRNFAIKAGIQIPITSDLNGAQEESDYRAKLVLEWHL